MAQAKKPAKAKAAAAEAAQPGSASQAVEDAVVLEEVPPHAKSESSSKYGNARIMAALLVGVMVAVAIGFVVAVLLRPAPAPVVVDNSEIRQLAADLADQTAALRSENADLQAQVTALQEDIAGAPTGLDIDGLGKRLDQVTRTGTEQGQLLATLVARLAEVEARPTQSGGGGAEIVDNSALVEAEMAAMRAFVNDELKRIEAAQAELAAARDEATDLSGTVAGQLAFSAVERAVDSGRPFQAELASLQTTGVEIPGVLAQSAAVGVASLAALQEQFPALARAALNAVTRAEAGQDAGSKLGAFIRIQLGVRSLEPRDGDSADAILSRAEAALNAGDIAATLDEIGALPEAGATELAGWVELAQTRLRVQGAMAALSTGIGN